ncbi:MAG: hypothetical protein IMZ54_02980 [Acidobacteria bacterium]|nr:hypothetical protein [Acidobacteriota bacterium]
MSLMSIYGKKAILFISVILICYLAYEAFTLWQEERLVLKAAGIHKGMGTDKVIEIMGKPNYKGFNDSSRLPAGWDLVWKKDFEEVRKKYDKLLFYNYHIRKYKFPSFQEKIGGLHINIYFDSVDQRVVYVSRFYAIE